MRILRWIVAGGLVCCSVAAVRAQVPTPEGAASPQPAAPTTTESPPAAGQAADPSQPNADPSDDAARARDAMRELAKKKDEKKPPKPDFEVQSIRAAPSDGIPFVKLNHWTQFVAYTVANNFDYSGELRSAAEALGDPAHRARYARPFELVKGDLKGLFLPIFLSAERSNSPVQLSLAREGGAYPVVQIAVAPQFLAPHQFLFVVLAEAPSRYTFLNNLQCIKPPDDLDVGLDAQERFYHRVVTSQTRKDLLLAPSMLYWTTTSHVLWDDLPASKLSGAQETALVDWLHWGGQLIVSGGPSGTRLDRTFLDRYLPADTRGTVRLTTQAFEAQFREIPRDESAMEETTDSDGAPPRPPPKPGGARGLQISPESPLVAGKLEVRKGAAALVTEGEHVLVAERRVGRGRIVQTAFPLDEPVFVEWRRYEDFFRAAILRQPRPRYLTDRGNGTLARHSVETPWRLSGGVLSWVRFFSRDTGVPQASRRESEEELRRLVRQGRALPPDADASPRDASPAEWRDDNAVAKAARDIILGASGIDIPPPQFVGAMILGYAIVLVGLNWLAFRLAGRVEWAWAAVPVIAIASAVGVIRLARLNIGFESQASEVAVVEAFGDYTRAHVTRITGLYNSSRTRYRLTYPDQTALALPFPSGTRAFRGQHVEEVTLGVARPLALEEFQVHPRSIGMVRSEQMLDLEGTLSLTTTDARHRQLVNGTKFDLDDVVLCGPWGTLSLGRIEAGASRPVEFPTGQPKSAPPAAEAPPSPEDSPPAPRAGGQLDPSPLVGLATGDASGEVRLVGWTRTLVPGQWIEPAVGQQRGVTMVVAHLALGPLEPPDLWGSPRERAEEPEARPPKDSPPLRGRIATPKPQPQPRGAVRPRRR